MKRINAVIFDLDGVLVFTDRFHYQAWKTIADSLNIHFDEEINRQLRGVSRMDSLNIILAYGSKKDWNDEEKSRFAEQKNDEYKRLLLSLTKENVSEDARATLARLRELGYRIAVGSSSKNAKFILEQVDLLASFDAIVDGNDITKSKPDPEVFLKAAEVLNEKPENCLVVEDAEAGIDAAKTAGMTAAAIHAAVDYPKADISLHALSDLLSFLS